MDETRSWEFVVESVPNVIIITNHRGEIVFANSQIEEMFGYEKEEILGQSVEILIPERNRVDHLSYRAGYAQDPGPRQMGAGRDFLALHNDGREFPVEVGLNPVKTDKGTMVVCVIIDITDRKNSEEKIRALNRELSQSMKELEEAHDKLTKATEMLIQAEKMSAVGTMVAGVAHELNNPLMGVINGVQYSLRKTAKDDNRYEPLRLAEKCAVRCIDIVRNLLTFSRYGDEGQEPFQIERCHVILDRVLQLLDYRISSAQIKINKHIDDEDIEIWMRPNNLQQVFLNLIANAIDALESSERKEIQVSLKRDEGNIEVTIEDTGSGIPSENMKKIFDPFFTTKAVGKGTGLGLSTCKNIIEQHGGEIYCESRVGTGTKFTILLPIERGTIYE